MKSIWGIGISSILVLGMGGCGLILDVDAGEYAPECQAGELECKGNTPRTCVNGLWQELSPCVGQTCMDGQCRGECESNTMRCVGNSTQTCNMSGHWVDGMLCEEQTCVDGQCQPALPKPYFMIAFDTSGSMGDVVAANNSCGYPNNRLGHGRCVIKNTLLAFSGQVNFGLATYARQFSGCSLAGGACPAGDGLDWSANCTFSNLPDNASGVSCTLGCGPEPSPEPIDSATRAGANIVVPMQRDNYYLPPLDPSNVASLLQWVDNDCTGGIELFPSGCTPMNGMLRDMYHYFSNQWVHPSGAPTHASPLGTLAQGERACRSVNIIFVTDGQETCDQSDDAADAALDMFNGFTKDGINWHVKTFVIDFGDAGTEADAIAAAGGTLSAKDATDESMLSAALADIISNTISSNTCGQ